MDEKEACQFELVKYHQHSEKAKLTGTKLTGKTDSSYSKEIFLSMPDELNLYTYTVKNSVIIADTSGVSLEAESEIIMYIFKNNYRLTISDLYGLFCFGTIVNYRFIEIEITKQNILHDGKIFKPDIIVPDLGNMKSAILRELTHIYPDYNEPTL